MSLIQIQNVCFSYEGHRVFENFSLEIESGKFCAVAGPNGVGKSTLLKLLAGDLRPSSGTIRIGTFSSGTNFSRSLLGMAAYVPQESPLVFDYSSAEIVMMARYARKKRFFFEEEEDIRAVREAMRQTFTEELAARPISCLSSGERQRLYLARAIAQETPILLLDEPVSHLDLKHQVLIYQVLEHIHREQNKTLVMVTHDLNLAAQHCDWMVLLGSGGRLISGPVREVLTEENICSIYDIKCRLFIVEGMRFFVPFEGKGQTNAEINGCKYL